jgi:hypothetical protein
LNWKSRFANCDLMESSACQLRAFGLMPVSDEVRGVEVGGASGRDDWFASSIYDDDGCPAEIPSHDLSLINLKVS